MIGKNQITLTFAGDASKLNKTFGQVGTAAQTMGGRVESASVKGTLRVREFGVVAAATMAKVGRELLQFGKESIAAFAEAEEAQTRLSDAFARFPRLADTNIDRLRKLNTTLAQKTKFDDDAFASGQAVLAQFKLSGKQIEGLTPLLADYAAKTGKDLPDAATALGKAFLGNTKALKALGINYQASTANVDALKTAAKAHHTEVSKGALALAKQRDAATDVKNITKLLRDQVGGFAEQQGKTAAGQAAILSNRFGEMKEQLGEKLLPVMMKATEIGTKVIDWISKNSDIVLPLIGVIAAVTIAQWAWNVAMSANPIGLIIIGIAALVAAIVWVATKTRFFQTVWGASWGAVKAAAVNTWEWLKALPGRIGNAFARITNMIVAPFRAAFNMVSDAWNNTIGSLSWTVPGWVPGIGGNSVSAPRLPHFHHGGMVPGAPGSEMLAVLQAGEQVTPAGQAVFTLEIRSGGSRFDDLLVEILARAVKTRGGNVQVVLGR